MAASSSLAELQNEHPWLPVGHEPFAGKYTVERIVGQGGMGIVFQARHIRLRQRVAIKVLGSALRESPELVERFEREARAAGSLTSAHAVRVFDIDATEDGTPFIVMELLAGRDLCSILENDGPQPVSRSVRWLIEACDAIAEAHRLGIIHRDLKPSNLFLSDVEDRKVVKVLDFGIAKRVSTRDSALTQAFAPLGTPQYMSPEQVRCAKDVDMRTDVWSLGVTLYELVCGQTPFAHESASACIASIAADPVPDPRRFRPALPAAFVAVVMRALEKNVMDRYQSIEELVAALAPFSLDDSCEDEEEEMVSAIRPAYVPAAQSVIEIVEDCRTLVREPVESLSDRSDRPLPPDATPAQAPSARRFKSTFLVLGAAALGAAALVLAPRFIAATGMDSTPANANVAHAAMAAPMSAATEPVVAPVAARAAGAAPSVEAAAAPLVTTSAPIRAAAPPARVTIAVASPALPPPRVKAKLEEKDVVPAPRSSVHGGLSNPGF